jgi:hypothetical protein
VSYSNHAKADYLIRRGWGMKRKKPEAPIAIQRSLAILHKAARFHMDRADSLEAEAKHERERASMRQRASREMYQHLQRGETQ